MSSEFLESHRFVKREFLHGTRSRYVSMKCHCDRCRLANAMYYHLRAKERIFGRANPYVSTGRVRRHLRWLAKQNVGTRQIAKASGVPRSSLSEIMAGRRGHIRRLGSKAKVPSLQVGGRWILAATERKVSAFYRTIMAGG